mmetsp:Transcript_16984/g.50910  ORF Transcript_16984/g.50910 Transcript_16984/m.50910 type:complete len:226 (+) Transcript_16984:413-1090(+)
MPRACRYATSSPPRPNTYGSPPLSLMTLAPASANVVSSVWISSCVRVWKPASLPTYTMRAPGCTSLRMSSDTSLSYSTTSAVCISRTARNVNSPGSPGPVPIRQTWPGPAGASCPVACRRALTMRRKERSSSASESRSTLPRVAASSAAASLPALLLSPLPLALPAQHPATTLGRCRRCNAASVGVAGRACIAPCNAGTGSRRRRRGGLLQLAAQDGTAAAVARV